MKGSKRDFFKNVKHIKIQMKEICMNARRTNTQGNSNNQNSKKCDARKPQKENVCPISWIGQTIKSQIEKTR